MLEAIPIILDDGALRTYSDKAGDCAPYLEATNLMRSWYNSFDKRSRILTTWQTMNLSK